MTTRKDEITLESIQAMMRDDMLWVSEDGGYHYNAEIKECSANKDNVILHCWTPNGSISCTLPLSQFQQLIAGETVRCNARNYRIKNKQFPFYEKSSNEEKTNDD